MYSSRREAKYSLTAKANLAKASEAEPRVLAPRDATKDPGSPGCRRRSHRLGSGRRMSSSGV